MSHFNGKARFTIHLEVKGRNPQHVWTRARNAIALLRQQDPAGVTLNSLDYNGNRADYELRLAMREARKNTSGDPDYDARAEYRKLWKAAATIERLRDEIENTEPATEHEATLQDSEITALNVALRLIDAALKARHPIRELLAGYKPHELYGGVSSDDQSDAVTRGHTNTPAQPLAGVVHP